MDIIGLIGLGLIVIGFGYEMMETIKRKECNMSRIVVGMFIIASILLFYHAARVNDIIFMALNTILAGVNSVNFYYA